MATLNERVRNLTRVLEVAMSRGETTRSEVVALTGLSKATVSRQVLRLEQLGLLASGEPMLTEGRGRRATELRVSVAAGHVAGVSIGLRGSNVAIADLGGRELRHHVEETPRLGSLDEFVDWIVGLVRSLSREAGGGGELLQVAVGIPAQVSGGSRIFRAPEPLTALEGSEFHSRLERALGAPVLVDTDATMALEGSVAAGLTDETTPVVLFTMSTALTSTVRTAHGLIRGGSAAFGDFSRLPIAGAGVDHGEGAQSIGSLLSLRGLTAYAAARGVEVDPPSMLWTDDSPELEAVREAFATALFTAIRLIAVTTGPELCIATGRLAPLAARVLESVHAWLEEALGGDAPRVVTFGADDDGRTTTNGAVRSALALARSEVLRRVAVS